MLDRITQPHQCIFPHNCQPCCVLIPYLLHAFPSKVISLMKNCTPLTNKHPKQYISFTNYIVLLHTSLSRDLFQLCLCTATIVEKDEPYKPFSHCRAAAIAGRGPQPQARLCSSTLSFDFSNFFFSAAECGGRCKAAEPGRLFWETHWTEIVVWLETWQAWLFHPAC